jgi:hypothetical protein
LKATEEIIYNRNPRAFVQEFLCHSGDLFFEKMIFQFSICEISELFFIPTWPSMYFVETQQDPNGLGISPFEKSKTNFEALHILPWLVFN